MRAAFNEVYFLSGEDGEFYGLSLGSGGCAEHERGIRGLAQCLAYTPKDFPLGVEDRLIPALNGPPHDRRGAAFFKEYSYRVKAPTGSAKKTVVIPAAVLVVGETALSYANVQAFPEQEVYPPMASRFDEVFGKPDLPYELLHRGPGFDKAFVSLDALLPAQGVYGLESDRLINSSWDDSDARVVVFGPRRVQALRSLYNALKQGKATLGVSGPTNPFGRGALCLCDSTKVSEEQKRAVMQGDLERIALRDKVRASGIEKDLEAGCREYCSLQPRAAENGDLFFLLGPKNQMMYNSGWFSLRELQDWAKGKGPVFKDNNLFVNGTLDECKRRNEASLSKY